MNCSNNFGNNCVMQAKYTNEKVYETLLVISAGLIFVSYLFRSKDWHWYLPVAVFVIIVLSLSYKPIGQWITIGWYKLSEAMGWVMQRILLSVVFYLFLFPIALLAGGSSRKTLKLKRRQDSYYDERNMEYDAKSMENIF